MPLSHFFPIQRHTHSKQPYYQDLKQNNPLISATHTFAHACPRTNPHPFPPISILLPPRGQQLTSYPTSSGYKRTSPSLAFLMAMASPIMSLSSCPFSANFRISSSPKSSTAPFLTNVWSVFIASLLLSVSLYPVCMVSVSFCMF